jgi:ubiquinone/menaquinone biosynthesis C-methylase UbiE
MKKESIKKLVRERYGIIAAQNSSSCCPGSSCCGSAAPEKISRNIGYTKNHLKRIPKEANLGLGCGNPVAFATLKKGETVLDLGSGAGIDCFLAADRVGEKGKVIGVDMTPEMIDRAMKNVLKSKYRNIKFLLGEIENLPVADNSIDAVISNCVINLVPDKIKAFKEIFRVLKPGGRLLISDIVLRKELPGPIKQSIEAYVGCVSGALLKTKYLDVINEAGFEKVKVLNKTVFPVEFLITDPNVKALIDNSGITVKELKNLGSSVLSIKVYGLKPKV